jgi:hypothetical protein
MDALDDTVVSPIKRGLGFTPTERNLEALADKIFLNLWSYPNPFGSGEISALSP